jgi:putative ABC transport system substrate-binding protein
MEACSAVGALLADLIASKVTVIAVLGNDAIAIAKRSTTIPIVMTGASHPVEMGFVETLSRPGGHVTGLAYNTAEVAGKLLEVLKQAFAKVARIAVVWNSSVPGITLYQPAMHDTASTLGLNLHWIEVRKAEDADAAFAEISKKQADALYVVNDTVIQSIQPQILSFIGRARLPAIYTTRQWADAGGLMYYGPSATQQWRRVAYFIDRILKGAQPADLPVEQPARFDLVINAKTARAQGLTLAPAFLARADLVIE